MVMQLIAPLKFNCPSIKDNPYITPLIDGAKMVKICEIWRYLKHWKNFDPAIWQKLQ